MNYIYEEMLKVNAVGVIFHPIFQNKENIFSGKCQIYSNMTLEQIKNATCFLRSGRTYYKIVDGKMLEIK